MMTRLSLLISAAKAMSLLIKNIRFLVHTEETPKSKYCGEEMSKLNCIEHAWVLIASGLIHSFGSQSDLDEQKLKLSNPGLKVVDAKGGSVFPSWCDAHTHLVYSGSREMEFADRLRGLTYEQIAQRGGGILTSVARLRKTSGEELFRDAMERIDEIMWLGTGAVEIKSGYGLDMESELKMLRVIRRIKEESQLTVKATFLGAHAIPVEFENNKEGYLDLIIREMLPAIAAEKLADYCDIFCERNYFSRSDAIRLFDAARKHGLLPKVHAEQLSHHGGIEAGVESEAISVDHLEYANEHDIALLRNTRTMPVLLPGAQFFLDLPRPPARAMIAAGLPVAICSDFNPGSSPSGNMNQMVSLACILYKLTTEEAIIAATSNSAYAMGCSETQGSIAVGKKANLFITRPIPSYDFLPYYFGENVIEKIILNGNLISQA